MNEHLATACILENGKTSKFDTYVSDVDGVNAFFND
ncbi:Ketosteroid isomerase (fragment) [Flavobacterium sp. 9AF]